jgi:hypothetical protein
LDRLHAPAALFSPQNGLTVTGGAPAPPPAAPPPAAPPPPAAAAPAPTPAPPVPPSTTPGTVVLVGGASPLSARVATSGAPADAMHFIGADVQPVDSAAPAPTDVRWTFDRLLQPASHDPVTADDGSIVLPPGDTSSARQIVISVPDGVTAFRLSLEGSGMYVFTVPGRAPDKVSLDEQEDSRSPDNVVANDPHFPGRVVRNKLWLMFRSDATPEQRQAVVDAVDGVVVGGMLRGEDRYYYLRIPANPDSGAAPLQRALHVLAPMPQVQDVMPDLVR